MSSYIVIIQTTTETDSDNLYAFDSLEEAFITCVTEFSRRTETAMGESHDLLADAKRLAVDTLSENGKEYAMWEMDDEHIGSTIVCKIGRISKKLSNADMESVLTNAE
jgi:hypothetical protein